MCSDSFCCVFVFTQMCCLLLQVWLYDRPTVFEWDLTVTCQPPAVRKQHKHCVLPLFCRSKHEHTVSCGRLIITDKLSLWNMWRTSVGPSVRVGVIETKHSIHTLEPCRHWSGCFTCHIAKKKVEGSSRQNFTFPHMKATYTVLRGWTNKHRESKRFTAEWGVGSTYETAARVVTNVQLHVTPIIALESHKLGRCNQCVWWCVPCLIDVRKEHHSSGTPDLNFWHVCLIQRMLRV